MSRARQLALSSLAVAAALCLAGWLTGLRQTMHVALLSVATVAFLPFVVIAACLLLAVIVALVAALAGEGGGEVHAEGLGDGVEAAAASIPGYYRWLASQRHPLFWGALAGSLLGGLLLAGFIALAVLPGEARTVQLLADAKGHLEGVYAATGSYPEPVKGHLLRDGDEVRDGFGRALLYERSGQWKLASFTLTSAGYDGAKGADDLCLSGSTQLLQGVTAAVELAKLASMFTPGEAPTLPERLAAIKALHCE